MFTEVKTTRVFELKTPHGDLQVFITPITPELRKKGCKDVKGYVLDHITLNTAPFEVDYDLDEVLTQLCGMKNEESINFLLNLLPLLPL